jgi:hypothetical protein
MIARWVLHEKVEEHLSAGWLVCIPPPGTPWCSHDFYAVLMSWICECPMGEPTK